MSYKTTAVLLAIFVLVAGYFYFFQSNSQPQARTGPDEPRVTSVEQDDVVRFSTRQGDKTVTAVRNEQDKQWYLDGSQRQVLDTARFNGVVLLFSGPRAKRMVAEKPSDLALYGLAKPKLEVTLETKDGTKTQVLLGDLSPDESYQYVKTVNEDAVYLVDRGVGDVVENFVSAPPVVTPTAVPASPAATPSPTS